MVVKNQGLYYSLDFNHENMGILVNINVTIYDW